MLNRNGMFCLVALFDVILTTLLWFICTLFRRIDNSGSSDISKTFGLELEAQICEYNIHDSIFDLFLISAVRSILLLVTYTFIRATNFFMIAFTTIGSTFFVIFKAYQFKWMEYEYLYIPCLMFIPALIYPWIEAYFLEWHSTLKDCMCYKDAMSPIRTDIETEPLILNKRDSNQRGGADYFSTIPRHKNLRRDPHGTKTFKRITSQIMEIKPSKDSESTSSKSSHLAAVLETSTESDSNEEARKRDSNGKFKDLYIKNPKSEIRTYKEMEDGLKRKGVESKSRNRN